LFHLLSLQSMYAICCTINDGAGAAANPFFCNCWHTLWFSIHNFWILACCKVWELCFLSIMKCGPDMRFMPCIYS
jgi:hypothetical protein